MAYTTWDMTHNMLRVDFAPVGCSLNCTVPGWVDEHELEQLSWSHWSMLMLSNHFPIHREGWKLCSITLRALLDYKPAISWYCSWMWCYTACSIYTHSSTVQLLLIWAHCWNMVLFRKLVQMDCQRNKKYMLILGSTSNVAELKMLKMRSGVWFITL